MTIIGSGSDATNEQDHGIIEMSACTEPALQISSTNQLPNKVPMAGGGSSKEELCRVKLNIRMCIIKPSLLFLFSFIITITFHYIQQI